MAMDRMCNTCHKSIVAAGRKVCNKCNNAAAKMRDPERYAFNRLRSNAKRRNKPFTLSLTDFREFCVHTGYIKKAGREATCVHVDRIDETRGYHRDNIQTLTNAANVRKYVSFRYGAGDPADPDTNDRGMWYHTSISTKTTTPPVPF